ncbi:MAG: C-terminal target protein [Bacteroidetes bacterium]|nr:C-terminal target protein [Bacteroidota bacterium]
MKTAIVFSIFVRWLCVLLLFGFAMPLSAQVNDNGLYDNTKGLELYPPGYSPRVPSNTIEVITTSDGYDNFDVGVNNAEQHMSSNPNNPVQLIFGVNGSGTPWRHSEDGGLTWAISTPPGTNSGDPWSAYDSTGTVYVQWLSGSNNPVFRSSNNGVTWLGGVTSSPGSDRNTMAVDQTSGPYGGYVYAGAWGVPGSMCQFARSTNNGVSFTSTLTTANTVPGNMIAVGANVLGGQNVQGGCVYFVSTTGAAQATTFNFFCSTDGGATFTPKSNLTVAGYVGTLNTVGRLTINNARTRPYPMIAADNSNGPYRGRLYLVYASNEPAGNGNKPDIFIQYSTDQGATWTPRSQRINDNPNPTLTNEWFPFIWCDKNTGRLYAKWYDMRNDPTNLRAWVYATYSDDGGQTFAPNLKLSNADMPYPGVACAPNTNCYRGDYDCITSAGDVAIAVWTDWRNNTYQNMLAYFPDFAMLVSQDAALLSSIDSTNVFVKIPSVKYYTSSAKFTAAVSPSAPFVFSFIGGRDSLSSFPDSVQLKIKTDNVTPGTYSVTVTGRGPKGTPVHRRTITVTVTNANAVGVVSPNGGETWAYGSSYNIIWGRTGVVDSVRIEYSTDNGTSWGLLSAGVPATPSSYAWAVPNTPTTQGRVRVSWTDSATVNDISNAAFTIATSPGWTTQTSGIASRFYSVKAVSQTVAWAAGLTGNVRRTTNGGTTWTSAGGGPIGTADIYSIEAVDANTAFVTTSPAATFIYRTTDGGANWTQVYTDASTNAFIDVIKMFNATNGIALGDPVGGRWVIVRTTDGGATWARDTVNAPLQVGTEAGTQNDLCAVGTTNIWFGSSADGRVYRTTDGGTTWLTSTLPGATAATRAIAVWFLDTQNGIASSVTGTTYNAARTTDGGATWSAVTVGTAGYNIAVGSSGTTNFWMGRGTAMFRSQDRGATWAQSYTGTGTFYDADFRTSGANTYGWGVKDNGNIVFFFGPLTGVQEERIPTASVPQQVALMQNYPNPFNPSTTISYELPTQATVRLKIFNMLGQEIATLVDSPQPSGVHQASWNGNTDAGFSASSGMYIYRLDAKTADGKTINSVKKMLLLK